MRIHSKAVVIVAAIVGSGLRPQTAQANVVDIPVAQDATVFGGAANTAKSSSGPGMFVGTDAMGLPKRGLISFDVASYLPIDATITDVSLSMILGQIAGSGGAGSSGPGPAGVTIGLYQVTTPWQGSTNGTTGHTSGFGGTGQGFLANPGDATWTYASYSTTPWANVGGDFVGATRADASIGTTIGTAYTWASTPALIADVQGWLDGAIPNDGLLLKNNDETDLYTYRAFYTREGASEQGVLPGATHEISCRLHTEFLAYPARSLSM